MKEIDHEYTDEIVCPHCGYEYNDSIEIGDQDQDETCIECGEYFSISVHYEVHYSTDKETYKAQNERLMKRYEKEKMKLKGVDK